MWAWNRLSFNKAKEENRSRIGVMFLPPNPRHLEEISRIWSVEVRVEGGVGGLECGGEEVSESCGGDGRGVEVLDEHTWS